jgi:hypothetical protein
METEEPTTATPTSIGPTPTPGVFTIYYEIETAIPCTVGCQYYYWVDGGSVTAPVNAVPVSFAIEKGVDFEYWKCTPEQVWGPKWNFNHGTANDGPLSAIEAGETFDVDLAFEFQCGADRRGEGVVHRYGINYNGIPDQPTLTPTPSPTPTPGPTPTPTLTPTPVAGTYCCTLVCDSGGDPTYGTLPIITVGQGVCAVFDPVDLSLLGLGVLPGFQICLTPIRFGSVGILGVSISLDFLSIVLAGLLALRLLWRS